MRIPTNPNFFNGQYRFMTFIDLDQVEPQTDRESKETKLVDGKPVYPVPVIAINRETGREEKLSIKVFNNPSGLKASLNLELKGQVLVTPWVNGQRINYSVIAEEIGPKEQKQ